MFLTSSGDPAVVTRVGVTSLTSRRGRNICAIQLTKQVEAVFEVLLLKQNLCNWYRIEKKKSNWMMKSYFIEVAMC